MNRWSPQRYKSEGLNQGVDQNTLSNALSTAELLRANSPKLPPIFTLRHLAHEAGVPYALLRAVVARSERAEAYKVFKLKKAVASFGANRFRYICVPHPSLLKVQRWIHKHILMQVDAHPASYAYKEKTSPCDAATMHAGCTWMIKLDATNFFESILEPDVYFVFRDMGYQALVAFELARLCTRVRPTGNPVKANRVKEGQGNLPYRTIKIGHLPQGAATSPLLSNLVARKLDCALTGLANDRGLTYTRYADDLTFSSFGDFDRDISTNLVREIYEIMRTHGLWPNKSKTKIIPPGARKVVLGLLVDGPVPRLTKEFKAEVRTHIHFMLRPDVGVRKHLRARKFDTPWGMQNYLFGKLAYAQPIEPRWTARMRDLLRKIDWTS
ncbi:reverse transcriptase family protein [Pseudomonas sp. Irchel 3E13]|jgi:hypothetical protein|uniref:reverse transcriptase family protein n=1 Tax=Pseudomonas sp. Irchel 3E13 TaxID=2008975 RepID=UPI000BA36CDB|nr:reverse transcriptase family protein [Pseudomonas sp. Irchel 3E13]